MCVCVCVFVHAFCVCLQAYECVYICDCMHVCVCGVHEYMFVCLFMYTLESSSLRSLPWCVHVFHISAVD